MSQVTWKDEPEEHDFPAASDYLLLLAAPAVVGDVVQDLHDASTAHWKVKDIPCRLADATGTATGRGAT